MAKRIPHFEHYPSFVERSAKRSAEHTARQAARDEALAAAEAEIAAAKEGFAADEASAADAAVAEDEKLQQALQRAAHTLLKPLVAAFLTTFMPREALAVAEALQSLHATHLRLLPALGGRGGGMESTIVDLVWCVFADLAIARDPACRSAFARSDVGLWSGISETHRKAVGAIYRACEQQTLDALTVTEALQRLQRSVAVVAAGAGPAGPHDAARWETNCFGGSPAARTARHEALDRAEEEGRQRGYESERALGDAVRADETLVIPDRDTAWHKAQRAISWAIGLY
jgi:hypothetical protein